jgi:hypothetical protein
MTLNVAEMMEMMVMVVVMMVIHLLSTYYELCQ